jgi:hypothetical protein
MMSVKNYEKELAVIKDELIYLRTVAIPNLKALKSDTQKKLNELKQLLKKGAPYPHVK